MLVQPERLGLGRARVILGERRVRERVPLVRVDSGNDDPLAKRLTPARRVEEVCTRERKRTSVVVRVGELEHHRPAGEAGDNAAGALEARHAEGLRCANLGVPRGQGIDNFVVTLACIHLPRPQAIRDRELFPEARVKPKAGFAGREAG